MVRGGTNYARKFAKKYGIKTIAAIGKPDVVIDDNPKLRPAKRTKYLSPEQFESQDIDSGQKWLDVLGV